MAGRGSAALGRLGLDRTQRTGSRAEERPSASSYDFKKVTTHPVKHMHRTGCSEEVGDRFTTLHTHTHTLRVGCCQAACSCPFLSETQHRQQGSAAVAEELGNPAGTHTHTHTHGVEGDKRMRGNQSLREERWEERVSLFFQLVGDLRTWWIIDVPSPRLSPPCRAERVWVCRPASGLGAGPSWRRRSSDWWKRWPTRASDWPRRWRRGGRSSRCAAASSPRPR